ncbi:MAG: hypothetical protein KDA44_00230, partial [Planctomycetales bacterium]|nr:hypothetical protein [Planctomycetales bacterium]
MSVWLLLAQSASDAAGDGGLTSFHLLRLEQFDEPQVLWAIVAAASALLVGLVAWQYRRESSALPRAAAWGLAALRIVALAGAIVFFLGPVKRTDRRVVTESRVEVLVDASQSMTVSDEPVDGGSFGSRSEAAVRLLADSPLIAKLRDQHDVSVRVFDSEVRRAATWQRTAPAGDLGDDSESESTEQDANAAGSNDDEATANEPAWSEALAATGAATRLGDALATILGDPAGGPLAGVIVVSDGGNNGGVDPLAAADRAVAAHVPVVAVGVGSTEPRRNLRLQDLIAPARAYPDDKVTVRAQVSAEGFAGRQVEVELYARQMQGDAASAETLLGRESLAFDQNEQTLPVEFPLEPAEIGPLELEARIVAPPEDQYPADNMAAAEMVIVETSSRVLLVAGSAARDYRFLRNQLFRDRHVTVDILLQSSPPGISQESNRILTEFPSDRETLFEYDAIVAFDPDWTQLDAEQVDLLEEWVADEAGGLIVVAGPVHTATWVQSAEQAKIRSLYPVEFQRRLTLMDDGVYGSKTPWPLDFTRAGEEADFLWLAETPAESEAAWARFPGVYGCYAVKG